MSERTDVNGSGRAASAAPSAGAASPASSPRAARTAPTRSAASAAPNPRGASPVRSPEPAAAAPSPHTASPAPRRRAVTQADVAREAGVSRGLVSLALKGSPLVADATREHILAVAHRLGYRVNRTAASLASGRTGLIGLVLPDLRNPFFDFIADGLRLAAHDAGLSLVIAVAPGAQAGQEVLDTMLSMHVEGLVLVSPAMSDAAIRALAEDTAVCVIGRASAGGQVDTVRLDEEAAAVAVVDHLRQAGATRLAYLTPTVQDDPNSSERGRALRAAAAAAGVELESVLAGHDAAGHLRGAVSRALGAGERLGVVAHNDVVALDALAVLRPLTAWTPLVSYDDTYLARREEFSLSSVEQPTEAMARDAIRFLCERSGRTAPEEGVDGAAGPGRNVTVAPVLAVRRSSTEPR